MAEPTFAGIDFGFSGSDASNYRSFVRVVIGGIDTAQSIFSFPGYGGEFVTELGKRGRRITWHMQTYAKSEAYMAGLESAIEAKLNAGAYTMTAHGRTFYNVKLMGFEQQNYRELVYGSFVVVKSYSLLFRELTP